ncbi:MAG: cyclic nucleotide-binding domain-containing protein, partial [Spirochaetales bacterium]|nr:cyclic nucleotide-binding domain-containing protein [Spirochaetales bacterium]
ALNPINAEQPYLRSFYWTVTTLTTIGYGDISPSTRIETIFVIIVELIGAGMYGFIIGNIANIIANIDVAKSQYQEKMEKVSTFMRYKNIPADLKHKISDYYDYLWESRRGYDESSILEDLPKPLKTSISLFLNREIIQKVPIFQGTSEEFIKEVILNLEPVVFTPGDYVVIKGEIGYEMYFISRGSVDVVSEDESIVYATLGAGSFFGEIALLLSAPRNATIKARDYCDCYSLKKETFDQILERFPEFAKRISDMAEKRRAETEEKQRNRKQ